MILFVSRDTSTDTVLQVVMQKIFSNTNNKLTQTFGHALVTKIETIKYYWKPCVCFFSPSALHTKQHYTLIKLWSST